jgi:two-component system, OmpR family, alkaline phosphatase synthesis response regulator PhoP
MTSRGLAAQPHLTSSQADKLTSCACRARILVIEDNAALAFGLRNNLEIEGYEVAVAADGAAGVVRTLEWRPDLVILDLMLPEMDGFRVLRTIRQRGFDEPVLILTARGEESDKVMGFRQGADDYVTKPFGVLELLARVDVLLRRAARTRKAAATPAVSRFGDVEVHHAARIVLRAGKEVPLAPMEFDLLCALVDGRGAVVSRHDLMRKVWGYDETVISRTVDTHIVELRRKLEADPARPEHILTVRKAGYRLRG